MKLQFLGTGNPRTERALSSYLVDEKILFDCGGGTVRRLIETGANISKINTLIISHFHGDHVTDLPLFLFKRWALTGGKEKLTVIIPRGEKRKFFTIANNLSIGVYSDDFKQFENCAVVEAREEGVMAADGDIVDV
jgi:ribonuclease BN (tRNA processing enzyme)